MERFVSQSVAFISLSIEHGHTVSYRPFDPFSVQAERRPAEEIKPAACCVRGALSVWASTLVNIRRHFINHERETEREKTTTGSEQWKETEGEEM